MTDVTSSLLILSGHLDSQEH